MCGQGDVGFRAWGWWVKTQVNDGTRSICWDRDEGLGLGLDSGEGRVGGSDGRGIREVGLGSVVVVTPLPVLGR